MIDNIHYCCRWVELVLSIPSPEMDHQPCYQTVLSTQYLLHSSTISYYYQHVDASQSDDYKRVSPSSNLRYDYDSVSPSPRNSYDHENMSKSSCSPDPAYPNLDYTPSPPETFPTLTPVQPPLAILQSRRLSANACERKSMNRINCGYERLKKVPPAGKNCQLSNMEALQMAQNYIRTLQVIHRQVGNQKCDGVQQIMKATGVQKVV
jgi:hypothetical protein